MKTPKRLLTIIAILIMASLTLAQTCPDQSYPPIPPDYGIDPNEIALDTEAGERLLLGVTVAVVGRNCRLQGYACDAEGDTFSLTASAGTMTTAADPNGLMLYEIAYVPMSAGLHYIHVSALDSWDAARTGTHVVVARINTPPVLCGGLVR